MIARVVLHGAVLDVRDEQRVAELLDGALERVEVHVLAVGAEGEHLRLVGQAVGALEVDLRELVDLRGLVAVVPVAREHLEHAGQGGGAHAAGVLAERVEDADGVAALVIGGQADEIPDRGAVERIGDDAVVAAGTADSAKMALGGLLGREPAGLGAGVLHHRAGDVVEAVYARDFLCKVVLRVLRVDVETPARDGDGVALHAEAELAQDVAHGVAVDVGAEYPVHAVHIQLAHQRLGGSGEAVNIAVHDLAGAQQLDQLAGAIDRYLGEVGVEALLVVGGGVGAHAEARGGAADAGAVEVGALEEDHLGVVRYLGVLAAHDAGDADGLVLVADAQHAGSQLALVAVQGADGLALARGADHDVPSVHAGEVEGVHRLAVLHHDIVCYVNYIVDRPHAHGGDALAHPLGRGLYLDVAHHARGVARAELGVLDIDLYMLMYVAAGALDYGGVQLQGLAEGHGGLAGQADDGEAVRAVRGYLELDNVVVAAYDGDDVVAGLAGLLDDEEAVLIGVGEVVQREAQLLERAHHAFRELAAEHGGVYLHAAGELGSVERHGDEVADLLVLRAGDYLQQALAADIDLAGPHVVGVVVTHHLNYLADHDAADALAHAGRTLDLGAGHGHRLGEVVVVLFLKAQLDELIEPLSR